MGQSRAGWGKPGTWLLGSTLTLLACGRTGITPIESPRLGGESSRVQYYQARCKSDVSNCFADAQSQCGSRFTVVHQESHAGGLLADVLPGPVSWYTVTFRCGVQVTRAAADAQQKALNAFVMPECNDEWQGRCGFITDNLESGQSIDGPPLAIETAHRAAPGGMFRRAARVCNEKPDALTENCVNRFRQTIKTLLQERYPYATDPRLLGWCGEHPEDCDPRTPERIRLLEHDFLVAHDRAIYAQHAKALQTLTDQARADASSASAQDQQAHGEQEVRQVRALMVQRAIDSMNPNQTTVNVNVRASP